MPGPSESTSKPETLDSSSSSNNSSQANAAGIPDSGQADVNANINPPPISVSVSLVGENAREGEARGSVTGLRVRGEYAKLS